MSKQNGGIIGPNNIPTGAFGSASGVWKLSDAINYKRQGTWPVVLNNFQVDNSCRFNTASSDYLTKTYSTTASSKKILTVSAWLKRSTIGVIQEVFSASRASDGYQTDMIRFGSSDKLEFFSFPSTGGTTSVITNRVFRDTSAWYNIVVMVNTTDGTAADRVRMYVNGVRETSFATGNYPAQNSDLQPIGIASGTVHTVGAVGTSAYYSGYLAEVVYADGQALDSSSFGEFDSQTGIWVPKIVTGLTFGNNGFYLPFTNASALGEDFSGEDNDYTVNNLTSLDQSIDTCTNNFATLNTLDNYYCAGTFSDGNNTIVTGSSQYSYVRGTLGVSQGKWYYEAKAVATSSSNAWYSIGWSGNSPSGTAVPLGNQPDSVSYQGQNGTIRINGSETSTGTTFTTGDIIGTALDLDNNLVYFYKNGTLVNLGGTAITASASTTNGVWCPAVGDFDSSGTKTWSTDFGSPVYAISSGNVDSSGLGNFEYAVPEGFYSLCTKNLNLIG